MWYSYKSLVFWLEKRRIANEWISIIIYLWILGLESNWKTKHCILLGLAVGFCALTYYNAYGYILCSALICLSSAILNKMDDETFELFIKYHLATCERQELIGASSHTIDILKK